VATAVDDPPLGWYSPGLDRKQPSVTVVMEAPAAAGARYHFELAVTFE
jgi:hypothetical protein